MHSSGSTPATWLFRSLAIAALAATFRCAPVLPRPQLAEGLAYVALSVALLAIGGVLSRSRHSDNSTPDAPALPFGRPTRFLFGSLACLFGIVALLRTAVWLDVRGAKALGWHGFPAIPNLVVALPMELLLGILTLVFYPACALAVARLVAIVGDDRRLHRVLLWSAAMLFASVAISAMLSGTFVGHTLGWE